MIAERMSVAISPLSYIDPVAEARVSRPAISAPVSADVLTELEKIRAATENSPESCGCLALENCPCVASVSLNWEPGGKPGSLSLKLVPEAAVNLPDFAILQASQSDPPIILDEDDIRRAVEMLGRGRNLSLTVDKDGNAVLYDSEEGRFIFKVNAIATGENLARCIFIDPEAFSAMTAQNTETERLQEESAAEWDDFWKSVKEYAKIGGGGVALIIIAYFGLGLLSGGKKMAFGEALEAYADQEERQARREMKEVIRKGDLDIATATALQGRVSKRDLIEGAGRVARERALAPPSPPRQESEGNSRRIPGTNCWQNKETGQVVGPGISSYMGVGIGRDIKAENEILKGIELNSIEDMYKFDRSLWRDKQAAYRFAENSIEANPFFSEDERRALLSFYAERSGVKK